MTPLKSVLLMSLDTTQGSVKIIISFSDIAERDENDQEVFLSDVYSE